MIKIQVYRFFVVLFLFGIISSCTDNVDFNQGDEIVLNPILESDLVFFNLETVNLLDEITQEELVFVSDTTRLELISDNFFKDNLTRTDLTFKFTNSFTRGFLFEAQFLDDANQEKYVLDFEVLSGLSNQASISEITEIIQETDIDTFKESTKVVVKFILPASTNSITSNTVGFLNMQSKATFYLEL
jgi:hypothetical protein